MRTRSRPATGLLLLALSLAGCGGVDADRAATERASAEAEAARAQTELLEAQAEASASASATETPVPSVTVQPGPESETAPAPVVEPAPSSPPATTLDFLLPDFTDVDLQTAQNGVQELGVFYTISHDLQGTRLQVVDSNWVVCDQTPGAGTAITGLAADWEGRIDFGVVKRGEDC